MAAIAMQVSFSEMGITYMRLWKRQKINYPMVDWWSDIRFDISHENNKEYPFLAGKVCCGTLTICK